MANQRIFLIIGVILIVAAGVLRFGLGSQFNQRFPDGWAWEVNTLGLNSFADEETGAFPEGTTLADDPNTNNARIVTVDSSDNGMVTISDRYVVRNIETNAIDWEFTTNATVEASTGQYVDGPYEGDYYFIPRNAEQTTYTVSNSTYESIPMEFQGEERVLGLDTYKYAFYGDLDNTAAYIDFDLGLTEGQKVVCFDFELEYWVEPTTGELIKYREWCEGDFAVDENGDVMYGLQRWGGASTDDDVLAQVNIVRSNLTSYNLMNLYLPLVLAVGGVLAIGAAFLPGLLLSDDSEKGNTTA